MDALLPRLLVADFDISARFWTAALRDLLGIEPANLLPEAGYASWDQNGEGILALFSQAAIAKAVGTDALPARPASQDTGMLVLRVGDVDGATSRLTTHGAVIAAPPQDRPEWGPNLRTAHLRAPDGTLVELQSY